MPTTRDKRFLIDEAVTELQKGVVWALYRLQTLYWDNEKKLNGEDRYWRVNALYHFGVALDRYKHYPQAHEVLSKCASQFADDADETIAYVVSQAMLGAGTTASRAGLFENAIQHLDRCVARLTSASSRDERVLLVRALSERAIILEEANAIEEADKAYDGIYNRFQNDDDPEICRRTALALYRRAWLLDQAGLTDRATAAFRTLYLECQLSHDQEIFRLPFSLGKLPKAQHALACQGTPKKPSPPRHARYLVESAHADRQQREFDGALTKLDEAIKLFGNDPRGEDCVWLARALHGRGLALKGLQRFDEALAAFNLVLTRFAGSSEPELREVRRSSLFEAGLTLDSAGRFVEAAEYFVKVIEYLKGATTLFERRSLAHAMYNHATMLRQAKRTEDAVRAFDATYKRFASDDDPHVCRFVARAVYNKATSFAEAEQIDRAITELLAAFEHCRVSKDPEIRERAARAIFFLSGQYVRRGQTTEWFQTLVQFVERCGGATEPAIQAYVGRAIEMCPQLLMYMPPAAHDLRSEYHARSYLNILEEYNKAPASPERDGLLQRYVNEQTEYVKNRAKRAAESHERARKVIENYWFKHQPFGLFLRNFESEAYVIEVKDRNKPFPATAGSMDSIEAIEEQLRAAAGPDLPLITISNISPLALGGKVIPKMEMRNEIWEIALNGLIQHAGLILIKLDKLTEGVLKEMDAVVKHGREDSTVVVLGDPQKQKGWFRDLVKFMAVSQVATSDREDSTVLDASDALADEDFRRKIMEAQLSGGVAPTDPTIPRFALVINESELPEKDGRPLPALTDLMRRRGLMAEKL